MKILRGGGPKIFSHPKGGSEKIVGLGEGKGGGGGGKGP